MFILTRALVARLAGWARRRRPILASSRLPSMALLIDGENIGAEWAAAIVAKASQFGCPTIRRVYGDWSKAQMSWWREIAESYGFQQIQVPRAVPGKNAVDLALAVDAMDLLFEGKRCFCLASSDSDYAPLVRRLRAAGSFVLGVGRPEAPQMLRSACQVFITTDQLHPLLLQRSGTATSQQQRVTGETRIIAAKQGQTCSKSLQQGKMPGASAQSPQGDIPVELLGRAYQAAWAVCKRSDGWVAESALGQHLHRLVPGFKPTAYGFRRLRDLLERARDQGLIQLSCGEGGQWYLQWSTSVSLEPGRSEQAPGES
ncbi:NYN domain-containing protein [Thermogemmatispora sp.]|uniref:NYN domain-containing protein n=1 Tax=Thermogemmatispora sp. TaxID=1968838 RepID=UPI0035E46073